MRDLTVVDSTEDASRFARGWRMSDAGEDALGGDLTVLGDQLLLHHQVAYGSGQSHDYLTSRDGRSWTPTGAALDGKHETRVHAEAGSGIDSFAYSDGQIVAAGGFTDYARDRVDSAVIFASSDGQKWKRVLEVPDARVSDVAVVGDGFVASGYIKDFMIEKSGLRYYSGASEPTAWVSSDGRRWREDPEAVRSFDGRGRVVWRGRTSWIGDGDPHTNALNASAGRSRVFFAAPDHEGDRSISIVGEHRTKVGNPPYWSVAATSKRFVGLVRYEQSPAGDPSSRYAVESWTTLDGRRWTRCASAAPAREDLRFLPIGLAAVGEGFLAVSDTASVGGPRDDPVDQAALSLWTSPDGCEWTRVPDSAPVKQATAGFDGVVVMGGSVFLLGATYTDRMVGMKGRARRLHIWRWMG